MTEDHSLTSADPAARLFTGAAAHQRGVRRLKSTVHIASAAFPQTTSNLLLNATETLNRWLSLIARIEVFVGPVFLVYELKQNRDSAVFETIQANREQRVSMFSSIRDSDYLSSILRKVRHGEPLKEEEQIRYDFHLTATWAIAYSEWVQSDLGLAGGNSQMEMGVRKTTITSPGAIEWWESIGRQIYPAGFVDFVEARMSRRQASARAGLPSRHVGQNLLLAR